MLRPLYTLSILLYQRLVWLAVPFNAKAKKWTNGRKKLLHQVQKQLDGNEKVIWFHAASLGEFEQGRPLLEAIKKASPEKKILLTFFSPSGYEVRKNTPLADLVCYLPIDTPRAVKAFVRAVNPESLFIIKYEFWYNLLNELHKNNIPVYLVSGIFRHNQHFFQWWGKWFLKHLQTFAWCFVQDDYSLQLLKKAGIHQASISGDTRFDRVASIAAREPISGFPEEFFDDTPVIIAGSTWPADEKVLKEAVLKFNHVKWIFAPHQVSKEHIQTLMEMFPNETAILSNIKKITHERIIIVDSFGLLNRLYRNASLVYVGGGFGKGIHNLLEAAVYGCPVIFGPNHHIFREAHELLKLGGGFTVKNSDEFIAVINKLLVDSTLRTKASEICKHYVLSNQGATLHVLQTIDRLKES